MLVCSFIVRQLTEDTACRSFELRETRCCRGLTAEFRPCAIATATPFKVSPTLCWVNGYDLQRQLRHV